MNNINFDEAAWEAFQEAAAEKYNFSTCQRPDGSYYGTGGTCRKGSPVSGGVPKKEKKSGGGSGGDSDVIAEQLRQINAQEGRGGGVGKNGRSPVGKKGIISDKEKAADKKYQAAFEKELDKRKAKMKGATPEEQSRLISEASRAASDSVK